jgi:TolA-binding protein
MHLLYLAGLYFNKSGRQAAMASDSGAPKLGFVIFPTAVLKPLSLLKTHAPFQQVKDIRWMAGDPGPLAEQVLRRVSKVFSVPFTWSPEMSRGRVAHALANRRVSGTELAKLEQGGRLEEYVRLAVDLERFDVDFDLGTSGGTPTVKPEEIDEFAPEEQSRVIEIFDPKLERAAVLAKPYGDFNTLHPKGAMVYTMIERIEEITAARVFWADGVDREDVLAHELKDLGDDATGMGCRAVLARAVAPLGMSVRTTRRDRMGELIAESNDCFNELRKFGMDTAYAEKALFNISVNFYYLKEYEKMKLALREYIKIFDTPAHSHYYDSAYWLGWVFERDRKFREAVKYYSLASEERITLTARPAWQELEPIEKIEKRLGYDTLVGLSRKVTGSFDGANIAEDIVPFVRFHTNIDMGLDPAARALETPINVPSFEDVRALDILYDVIKATGLGIRAENANPKVAQKAYFRIAMCYRKDNRMFEALENVQTLLTRYPQTPRYVDALKLKLDIHKGLNDYGNALQALEELRAAAGDTIEPYKLDYETGRIYFDMCDYVKAESFYSRSFTGSGGQGEWLKVREALAHTYARQPGKEREAITQYRDLMRYETSALRQSINRLMMHYLGYMIRKEHGRKPLPDEEAAFIKRYESLSDRQRATVGRNDAARASWIYYVSALLDIEEALLDQALVKLDAAGASPDSLVGGEALVRAGQLRMARKDFEGARETFQHLLFAVKAVEPKVRATYFLGQCQEQLEKPDLALLRYREILSRYPISPYAQLVKTNALVLAQSEKAEAPE